MQEIFTVEWTVYLITALYAFFLLPKIANWRFRILIGAMGLYCFAHAASGLRNHLPFLQGRFGQMIGAIEVLGGAVTLSSIFLLARKNCDRSSMEFRFRQAESVPPPEPRAASSEALSTSADPFPRTDASGLEEAPSEESLPKSSKQELRKHSRLRRHRRYPLAGEVEITVLADPRAKCPNESVDTFQSGTRRPLSEAIHDGALIKVEFGDCLFLGQVRYCENCEWEYCVGVQFEESLDFHRLVEILKNFSTGKTPSP
jgi:hypothetical protein